MTNPHLDKPRPLAVCGASVQRGVDARWRGLPRSGSLTIDRLDAHEAQQRKRHRIAQRKVKRQK